MEKGNMEDLKASKIHTKEFRESESTTACFNISINIISSKTYYVEGRERIIECLANHQWQAPGLGRGQQMAPGRSGLAIQYMNIPVAWSGSPLMPAADKPGVCRVFITVVVAPAHPYIYSLTYCTERTRNVNNDTFALPFRCMIY